MGIKEWNVTVFTENASHRLICFYSWFSVGGIVWEGLRNMPLLEKACHLWWVLRFQASFSSLSPACGSDISSQQLKCYVCSFV